MEGYDNEFVPPVEPRYECPICLLVLREPRQTKCGHRFCRDCIIRSLRDSSNRCPVDNEQLTENDVYPDNFAKREILNFNIRCPNSKGGCDKIFALGKLQSHLEECPLALVPCPFKCASIMPRRDIEDHMADYCENRPVKCGHCHIPMRVCDIQIHGTVCLKAIVICPHCAEQRPRDEIERHIEMECRQVEIRCPFHLLGCGYTMLRSAEEEHLRMAATGHMKLLCFAVTNIAQRLGMTQVICPTSHSDMQGTMNNLLQILTSGPAPGGSSHGESEKPSAHTSPKDQGYATSSLMSQVQAMRVEDRPPQENLEASGVTGQAPPSREYDDGQHRITSVQYHSSPTLSQQPGAVSPNRSGDSSSSLPPQPQSQGQTPRPKPPVRRLSYNIPAQGSPLGASQAGTSHHSLPQQDTSSSMSFNLASMSQDIVSQQLQCVELQSRITVVERTNSELTKRLKELEMLLSEKEARFFNGDFYWSINDFSQYRQKLEGGESSTLHSPPFYTSAWGYKICVRANFTHGSAPGSGQFLSLFVHFLQGQNDAFLPWPFAGKIILTVVDQNPDVSQRQSFKESLESNPSLAAFQKPTSPRNHKGFGYIEFMPIASLMNGYFVMDDTLVVRAQVFPYSY